MYLTVVDYTVMQLINYPKSPFLFPPLIIVGDDDDDEPVVRVGGERVAAV